MCVIKEMRNLGRVENVISAFLSPVVMEAPVTLHKILPNTTHAPALQVTMATSVRSALTRVTALRVPTEGNVGSFRREDSGDGQFNTRSSVYMNIS